MKKKENLLPSVAQQRAQKREAAMPEVKSLVKEWGRETIQWCLNQLREYDKKVEQLKKLKKEARMLAKEIK